MLLWGLSAICGACYCYAQIDTFNFAINVKKEMEGGTQKFIRRRSEEICAFLFVINYFFRPEDDLEQSVVELKDTGRIKDDVTENNSSVKMAGSTLRVLWPMTKFWPLPMMPNFN